MRVFIANFGQSNVLWPECLKRSTVATYEDEDEDLRPFWVRGDREGYIAKCLASKKSAKGDTLKKGVASRWFNLATIISSTENDIWLHHEKDKFWWTTSHPGAPQVSLEAGIGPSHLSRRVYVIHKPASPWSERSKKGHRLQWSALHPRARDFLFTLGTFHQLSEENAAYALALVGGEDLDPWHSSDSWKEKVEDAGKGAAANFKAKQISVERMVRTAMNTVAGSYGQQVLGTVKNKEQRFGAQKEFEQYVAALVDDQEGLCALTGLRLQYDGVYDDPELQCSLDRIDSNGHYEPGNLQVVCRFVNRWKSDDDDRNFRRLVDLVRSQTA